MARVRTPTDEKALLDLLRSIARGDVAALDVLAASPELVRQPVVGGATRDDAASWYLAEIEHYVYAGDTALHVAAAAYRPEIARLLLTRGALVGARNRALLAGGADPHLANKSGSTPLELATLTTGRGGSGSPEARREQVEILRLLRER